MQQDPIPVRRSPTGQTKGLCGEHLPGDPRDAEASGAESEHLDGEPSANGEGGGDVPPPPDMRSLYPDAYQDPVTDGWWLIDAADEAVLPDEAEHDANRA